MGQLPAPVRNAVEQPDGGVSVVPLEEGSAATVFRQMAAATPRTGFVPVLADAEAPGLLPPDLLHRHVAIVCDGDAGRGAAIQWVRRLAQASPRRHLVVTFGTVAPAVPVAPPGQPFAEPVSSRLARAERWRRRGRARAAEQWMAAACESARRRGDSASAASLETQLIAGLLDRDRIACAGRRLRDLLRRACGWREYSAAAALWTDVLIAREEYAAARAWAGSISAEAELRGEPLPGAAAARLAELDFWQGRCVDGAFQAADTADVDEAGWRGLQAWSARRFQLVAAVALVLSEQQGGDTRARYWLAVLRLLLADTADPGDVRERVDELIRAGVRSEHVRSRRRRRLAAVIVARALANRPSAGEISRVLSGLRGPGPEGTAAGHLAASQGTSGGGPSAPPARALRLIVPGVHVLTRGSRRMHLVDSLSSLLSVIEDAGDEVGVLTGGCRWLCRQSGAGHVAFVSADRTTLVAAEGWRRTDLAGEIAEILAGPAADIRVADQAAGAAGFGVSVRYGGITVGYVVARGLPSERPALQAAAHALAALCGPALRARLDALTATQRARQSIPELVGDSPLIAAVREAVTRAAPAPFPVLIEGESGTGKELVARALHRLGPRRDRRLNAVNCAALTDELVEAELFGHARGAFTGAVGPRAGLFEEAHGGTLFLDEVTELSPRAQAKLLRVLQEGEIRRVGENQPRPVDVRIVAACNLPIADAVAGGRFRDDLRFRLAVIRIALPALRERLEDVPGLALAFWRRAAGDAGTQAILGPDALARLTRHAWPGNVRELQNVIAGLVVAAPARGRVGARQVEQALSHAPGPLELPGVRLEAARRTLERRVILAALVRHAGRRSAAAAELGLTRQGLTKAMRRLGLAAEEDAAGVA